MHLIQETIDSGLIKSILAKDNTYNLLVYDGSPPLEKWEPDTTNSRWIVLYYREIDQNNQPIDNIAGLLKVDYLSNIMGTAHIVIYERFRGNNSIEWGTQTLEYMYRKYGLITYIAFTPYIQMKKYAEKVGFKYIKTVRNSIKKNGKLMDQFMLEYTRL